jgi:Ulp1 family protease
MSTVRPRISHQSRWLTWLQGQGCSDNYNQSIYSPISPASIPDDPAPPPAVAVPQPLLADPIPAVYQQGASAQYIYNHAINQPEANVIGNRAGVTLRAGDLLSVIGRGWLNDNVINYYFSMLAGRANQSLGVEVHCFSTFFYPSLTTGHTNPRCWTSGIDIFKKDFVLFPIHDNLHWYLAVFNVRRGTLNVYDSIPSPERKKTVLRRLREHIRDEHRIKRGAPYPYGLDEAPSSVVPTQNNSHDCGVFTCQFAKAILQAAGFHFCSKDMPVIRRTMIWEIVMSSISWDHVNPDLMNAG